MGAKIDINLKQSTPEPMGDIYITYQVLKNFTLNGEIIPNIIDEIPILAILALQNEGTFSVHDAKELRVKESDRIDTLCQNLRKLGIQLEEYEDGFAFNGPQPVKGGNVITKEDHRIAMAFAIANLISKDEIILDNPDCVKISFPDFWQKLSQLKE